MSRFSDRIVRYGFLEKGEHTDPAVEIGAVYYRRSNPPRQDWERDYAQARADGHTLMRHWFNWCDIHVAPDTFDFSLYDEHLALAEKYGIRTVIAEMTTLAPDWLYRVCPEGRQETADGNRNMSVTEISCNEGCARLCLDHPFVREQAGKFLAVLAERYRDCKGLYAYDVWNENTQYETGRMCWCPATQEKFRAWCRKKYGTLEALREAWRRRSLSCWEDIQLPRRHEPYPDVIDSLFFFRDNCAENFQWRLDVLRQHDPNHLLIAHGNGKTFKDFPFSDDMYTYGPMVQLYGVTYWYSNECPVTMACDMTRMASAGRAWWRAEAIGDADWHGRDAQQPMDCRDEMHDPGNIRLDAMRTLVSGARGYINPRWRALQDGYLQGAYGWYGVDGKPTERSEEVKKLARWCNGEAAEALWRANPIRGDLGLLMLNEAQAYCYAYYGSTQYFSWSYQGAYEAFLDSGIQADPIVPEQIDAYDVLYCPYPYALGDNTVRRLKAWVERGGTLISEGCFGYLNRHGHVSGQQPGRGLEELFGCRQDTVHLGPDRWNDLKVYAESGVMNGALYRQSYTLTAGSAAGTYEDGSVAIVRNSFGKGRTLLIGTMPGYGYHVKPEEGTRRFFQSLLPVCGKKPVLEIPINQGIIPRLWANGEDVFLWLVNQGRGDQRVYVRFDGDRLRVTGAKAVRGEEAQVRDNVLIARCAGRDAAVYRLGVSDE